AAVPARGLRSGRGFGRRFRVSLSTGKAEWRGHANPQCPSWRDAPCGWQSLAAGFIQPCAERLALHAQRWPRHFPRQITGGDGLAHGADANHRYRLRHSSRAPGEDLRCGILHAHRQPGTGTGGVQTNYRSARRTNSSDQRARRRRDVYRRFAHVMSENFNRVLVVDDEPPMRAALEANFRLHGWQVEAAESVTDGLAKFRRLRPPLVVTDIRMPDGDGLAVLRDVRTLAPRTGVILLTAYGNVSEAVEAMRSGACDYLLKPVSF